MKRIIVFDYIFFVIQIVLFITDIVLSFVSDVSIYFYALFGHVALFILYYAIIRSIINFAQVYNKKEYIKSVAKERSIGDAIKTYRKAKRVGDGVTAKYLSNGWISTGMVLANVIYVLIITHILHPESIG